MKLSDFVDPELPDGDRPNRRRTRRMLTDAEIRRSTIVSTAIISAIIYAIPLLIVVLDPNSKQITDKAFSSYPQLGLTTKLVACSIFTLIFVPFPFVVFHSVTILIKAIQDRAGLGRLSLLAYFIDVGKRHPHLRRSQFVVFAGLVYFFAICLAWIFYASSLGI